MDECHLSRHSSAAVGVNREWPNHPSATTVMSRAAVQEFLHLAEQAVPAIHERQPARGVVLMVHSFFRRQFLSDAPGFADQVVSATVTVPAWATIVSALAVPLNMDIAAVLIVCIDTSVDGNSWAVADFLHIKAYELPQELTTVSQPLVRARLRVSSGAALIQSVTLAFGSASK